MQHVFVLQYKPGSRSARALSGALGVRRLNTTTRRYEVPRQDLIINWGCNEFRSNNLNFINPPHIVKRATNKLEFFQTLEGNENVRTVPFTTNPEIARQWDKCVARTQLRASSGAGIVVVNKGEQLPAARLYTGYIKKNREFRVHVAFGHVIDSQRKIADPNREPTTWDIRNHANGFIFVRNSGSPTQASLDMAVATCSALGLDFGAVDLIENKSGTYILEVNTAPGLEGQTLENYRRAFEQEIRNRR